ncbi:hypothetical protein [Mycobacterium syngnathidarum]
MADLHVDAAALTAAATASESVADGLVAGAGTAAGTQPSHAGVAAVDAALASARDRQAARVSHHAQSMKVGSGVYRHTDDDGAAAVTRTV